MVILFGLNGCNVGKWYPFSIAPLKENIDDVRDPTNQQKAPKYDTNILSGAVFIKELENENRHPY
jgi:hypothetical protein